MAKEPTMTKQQTPGRAAADSGRATAHPDIFADTIAQMTWFEVDQAAKDGAILLWAFGVIEQHGPHLPTGTDVYVPSLQLRQVRILLAERGVKALIVPPFYWGINDVSSGFPASYQVRPSSMVELMADVFGSIRQDGFTHVFCVSGHGDALHNRTILQGVKTGSERTGLDISFVTDAALATRLGLELSDPYLTLRAPAPPSPARFVDVHAGQWETSVMMHACPGLVRENLRSNLESTNYGPNDLAEWRKGREHARGKTPLGYFGDPAAASPEEGERWVADSARCLADAIERRLKDRRR